MEAFGVSDLWHISISYKQDALIPPTIARYFQLVICKDALPDYAPRGTYGQVYPSCISDASAS